jgi:hypothetical protein
MQSPIFALIWRAVHSRPGKAGLGVIVLAGLAIVAYMNPVRNADSRHDRRPDGQEARLANGWVTNCTGPAFSRFSQGGNAGPGPERPVFKVNDQLVLAVPKKNWPSAGRFDRAPPECRQISDLPLAHYLYFVISGNWSQGYRPEDIPIVGGRKDFEPDVVTVRIEREMPSKLSVEEQQRIDQERWEGLQYDSTERREIGGLTCFVPKGWGPVLGFCSGRRTASDPDVTALRYRKDSAIPFVLLLADYRSSRHGGIHVYWKVWTSDVSHVLDIDSAIWKSIEDWNLLNHPGAQADAARANP